MFIYDIIQHIPRMAFWCAKCSSPNPWFFMRRCGQRTAMDAPVLTLPLPREAVLQGYQVQDRPVTMSDQTGADCRSHALGFIVIYQGLIVNRTFWQGFSWSSGIWSKLILYKVVPEILAPTTRYALKLGAFLLHRTWKVWWHEAAVMMQRPYRARMIC